MKADRFFSVPYDNRSDVKMLMVRKKLGGFAGYGRWVALLGILYDQDGIIDLNDDLMLDVVADELELDDVRGFFDALAEIGLIDRDMYSLGHVVNHGVCDEIYYKKAKSEAGKKGGRPAGKQNGKQNVKQAKKQVL